MTGPCCRCPCAPPAPRAPLLADCRAPQAAARRRMARGARPDEVPRPARDSTPACPTQRERDHAAAPARAPGLGRGAGCDANDSIVSGVHRDAPISLQSSLTRAASRRRCARRACTRPARARAPRRAPAAPGRLTVRGGGAARGAVGARGNGSKGARGDGRARGALALRAAERWAIGPRPPPEAPGGKGAGRVEAFGGG